MKRIRSKNESLRDLYLDIQQLAEVAYPEQFRHSEDDSTIHDAFITALNDEDLIESVRESRPKTLEAAYRVASFEEFERGQEEQYIERSRKKDGKKKSWRQSKGQGSSRRCNSNDSETQNVKSDSAGVKKEVASKRIDA